ncbi:hypothetical protein BH09BAC3_BH09BAC3_33880 [soil metagenome]
MITEDQRPIVIINFKGLEYERVRAIVDDFNTIDSGLLKNVRVILAVPPSYINDLQTMTDHEIFLQDIKSPFEYTVDIFLDELCGENRRDCAAKGVILNHPEKVLTEECLKRSFQKSKEGSLHAIVCSSSVEEGITLSKHYQPYAIAIENKLLLGKNESFTVNFPNLVKIAKDGMDSEVMVGGGVRSHRDFARVIDDGGIGVLVSSVIVNAVRPGEALKELISF